MVGNSPDSVASVLKVFGILQALSEVRGIGVTELSHKVMMPKSTVYRFLQTMKTLGYINQEGASDKYSLSFRLFELSNKALENQNFLKIADAEMRKLNEYTKETVHLAIREDDHVVYINKISSEYYNLCLSARIGSRASIHGTSLGKVLLAWLDQDIQQAIIHSIELTQFTEHTIITAEDFLNELAMVRAQGYAEDNEETELGLRCFAVPVYNHFDVVTASLSLSTSIFRCTDTIKADFIAKLHKTACAISKKIGCQNYPF